MPQKCPIVTGEKGGRSRSDGVKKRIRRLLLLQSVATFIKDDGFVYYSGYKCYCAQCGEMTGLI